MTGNLCSAVRRMYIGILLVCSSCASADLRRPLMNPRSYDMYLPNPAYAPGERNIVGRANPLGGLLGGVPAPAGGGTMLVPGGTTLFPGQPLPTETIPTAATIAATASTLLGGTTLVAGQTVTQSALPTAVPPTVSTLSASTTSPTRTSTAAAVSVTSTSLVTTGQPTTSQATTPFVALAPCSGTCGGQGGTVCSGTGCKCQQTIVNGVPATGNCVRDVLIMPLRR